MFYKPHKRIWKEGGGNETDVCRCLCVCKIPFFFGQLPSRPYQDHHKSISAPLDKYGGNNLDVRDFPSEVRDAECYYHEHNRG